jgi:hypothetical protein
MKEAKAAIKGFKHLEEAQRLLANVGDEYVICKVVSSQYDFDGEIFAYFVMHKDADPIRARGNDNG